MVVQIGSIPTNYIDTGGGGATVLFLHGWGAPITTYQSIFDHLAPKYRVVAVDTPGVGSTPEPPEGWNVDKYVKFVLDFCRELGIKEAILMGHSFGVRLMIKIMSEEASEIVATRAVIIDGAGIVPKRPMSYYYKVYSYKLAKKIAYSKLGNFLFASLFEERKKSAGSADYAAASDVMKHTLSLVVNEDLKHLMGKIYTDTLLIWGKNDTSTPLEDGKMMEQKFQNAGLAVVDGAGHYPFLEQPGTFFKILDAFL